MNERRHSSLRKVVLITNALEVILIPTEGMREGKRREVNVQIDDSVVKRKTQQLALF